MRYEILIGDYWHQFDWPHEPSDGREAAEQHARGLLEGYSSSGYATSATIFEFEPGHDAPRPAWEVSL